MSASSTLQVRKLTGYIGAEVSGVDLRTPPDEPLSATLRSTGFGMFSTRAKQSTIGS